jgi:tetratricopeptide (TPR) repeat protein
MIAADPRFMSLLRSALALVALAMLAPRLAADERDAWYRNPQAREREVAWKALLDAVAQCQATPTSRSEERVGKALAHFEQLSAELLPVAERQHPTWVACLLQDRGLGLTSVAQLYLSHYGRPVRDDPQHARELLLRAVGHLTDACDPRRQRRYPARVGLLANAYVALGEAEYVLGAPYRRSAWEHLRKAVELYREGDASTLAASVLFRLGQQYEQAGKQAEADRTYEEALAECRSDRLRFAEKPDLLRKVADARQRHGRTEEAGKLRAEADQLALTPPAKPNRDDLEQRFRSPQGESRADVVREVQRRTAAARRAGDREQLAHGLYLLGMWYSHDFTGLAGDDPTKALAYAAACLEEASALHRALWTDTKAREHRRSLGWDLCQLSAVEYAQQQYEASVEYAARAQRVAQEVGDDELRATAAGVAGKVFQWWGRVPDARSSFAIAAEACRGALQVEVGPRRLLALRLRRVNALSELADLDASRGRWDESLRQLDEALQECDQLVAHPMPAADLYRLQETLSSLLISLAERAEASANLPAVVAFLSESLRVTPSGWGPDNYARGKRGFTCALLAQRQGDARWQEQARRDRAALEAIVTDGSQHTVNKLRANLVLGDWALELDANADLALRYYAAAKADLARFTAGRPAPGMEVGIDLSRGQALLKLGRAKQARQAAQNVLDTARQQQLAPLEVEALTLLGDVARLRGDRVGAVATYEQAAGCSERLFHGMTASMESQIGVTQMLARPYLQLAETSLASGSPEAAFRYAEQSKARVLRELLERANVLPGSSVSAEDARQYDALSQRLWDGERLSAGQAAANADPQRIAATKVRLQKEREAYQAFVLDLQKRYPGLRERQGTGLSVDLAQALLLGRKAVLLEYVVFDEAVGLFVLDGQQFAYRKLATPRRELERLVGQCLSKLAPPLPAPAVDAGQPRGLYMPIRGPDVPASGVLVPKTVIDHDLERLHGALLQPVADLLGDSSSLVIVPDGFLTDLPFAALRDQSPRSQYLVQRRSVVMMPTAAMLRSRWSGEPASRAASRARAVAIAYSAPGEAGGAAYRLVRGTPGELRWAREEARRVTRALGLPARLVEEEHATANAFYAAAQEADYLHCASHFYADPLSPLDSYLRLAEDVTVRDLTSVPLHAELVTLSSCGSAGQPAAMRAHDPPMRPSWAAG